MSISKDEDNTDEQIKVKINQSATVDITENLIEEDTRAQAVDDEEDDDQVFIDIALGNKKHRITLTKSSDPETLAATFAQEHNLDSKMQKKLCE